MTIEFTDAAITDLPWIVEVYNSTVAGRMVTADTEPVSVKAREPWFYAHHARRPLWVVKAGGEQVGWVSLQDFYGRPAYNITAEISIYLAEAARGKGLGRLLLQTAMEKSKTLGIENLMGFIFEHNLPSVKLFEQAGFERWGHFPNIAVLDGVQRSLLIMGKKIR